MYDPPGLVRAHEARDVSPYETRSPKAICVRRLEIPSSMHLPISSCVARLPEGVMHSASEWPNIRIRSFPCAQEKRDAQYIQLLEMLHR